MENEIYEIPTEQAAALALKQMRTGGAFLTAEADGKANTMVIGWGGVTSFYGAYYFIAPVRLSRYTYQLLRRGHWYTVSVPLHPMKAELAFAGTASGRDVDKFTGHGITPGKAQEADAPIVAECELHFECVLRGETALAPHDLDEGVNAKWYADRDMHTFFLGEIRRCYTTKKV